MKCHGFRQILAMTIVLNKMWTKLLYTLRMYWQKIGQYFAEKMKEHCLKLVLQNIDQFFANIFEDYTEG